ncbi:helix-turn-helix domain-containing protein [Sphingobacterium yanglingense]|uniref:AraC family transcriptional regulator n=1 Tax=Sphingobacterium yanglingense TaxID=1437280 RepID=A0A4R6WLN4_9SPHI|nr:response regulator transcription factor [Sphingobacterium yanglingense]TDQ81734.1 AraC family transcriptional regulator [Sphingobacterium yanglingense]
MELAVKNMVCKRCVSAVEDILNQLEIPFSNVQLGTIQFASAIPEKQTEQIRTALENIGFELIEDPKDNLAKEVKTLLIELVGALNTEPIKLSAYLSEKLGTNYHTISSVFSQQEGITVEKYYIQLKIEKAKELLSYNELSLKEIAYRLNYSSVAHLSKQFKEIVGVSASTFRSEKRMDRKYLDQL